MSVLHGPLGVAQGVADESKVLPLYVVPPHDVFVLVGNGTALQDAFKVGCQRNLFQFPAGLDMPRTQSASPRFFLGPRFFRICTYCLCQHSEQRFSEPRTPHQGAAYFSPNTFATHSTGSPVQPIFTFLYRSARVKNVYLLIVHTPRNRIPSAQLRHKDFPLFRMARKARKV